MRYFISQAMRGRTDAEITAERKIVIAAVQRANPLAEYVDSFSAGTPKTDNVALYKLGESLRLLSTADMCIFVSGWEAARGCRFEKLACAEYGVDFCVFNIESGRFESMGCKNA